MPRVNAGRMGWVVRIVALGGAGAIVAAVFVPIDKSGAKLLDVTHGSEMLRQTAADEQSQQACWCWRLSTKPSG
jgi:hypothetical protein